MVRAIGALIALIVGAVALYLAIAIVLGAIPLNRSFTETRSGVPVYLRTNGVHADLIVPTEFPVNWSAYFPAQDMRALAEPHPWVAFGWGDRDFLLHTPTWSDLRPGTAIKALIGIGEGAMHVEYVETPHAYNVRRVRISADEYARLAAYIRGSFALADGRPQPIATGYHDRDAFYAAIPRYTFWFTCNEWTRRALSAGGIRTPLWAPFDIALFLHLDAATSSPHPDDDRLPAPTQ